MNARRAEVETARIRFDAAAAYGPRAARQDEVVTMKQPIVHAALFVPLRTRSLCGAGRASARGVDFAHADAQMLAIGDNLAAEQLENRLETMVPVRCRSG